MAHLLTLVVALYRLLFLAIQCSLLPLSRFVHANPPNLGYPIIGVVKQCLKPESSFPPHLAL